MAWIVDPAADVIWDSAGTVITAQGSAELAPTTEEGWAVVLHAAATLTEAGNLLMMPGRVAGDDWIVWAQQLVATGKLAIDAAEAQDADALFNAGGEIYQVCRGCHEQFWVEIPAPTASAQP
jgi:mono/diheme cytochrome c family protein